MPKRFRLMEMISRTGDMVYRFQGMQFADYHPVRGSWWEPAVNVYRCDGGFEVCIELAGVEKDNIQVSVFSEWLEVRGVREEPRPSGGKCCREVLGLEIETGVFLRRIPLPEKVAKGLVEARQENGYLWVLVPLEEKEGGEVEP